MGLREKGTGKFLKTNISFEICHFSHLCLSLLFFFISTCNDEGVCVCVCLCAAGKGIGEVDKEKRRQFSSNPQISNKAQIV